MALLYEGILTAVVRVQTSRQQVQDPESLRLRMKQALKEIASIALRDHSGWQRIAVGGKESLRRTIWPTIGR